MEITSVSVKSAHHLVNFYAHVRRNAQARTSFYNFLAVPSDDRLAAMLDKGGTASEGGEIEREERSGNVNSINSMEQRRKNCQHAGANGNLRCLNNNIREDAKLAKFFNNKLAWEEMSGADGDEMKWSGCRGCCQKDSF